MNKLSNIIQKSYKNLIFAVKDHIDPELLEQKVKQDLHDFNPAAKQLARDSRKLQMDRARCYNAQNMQCMQNNDIKAIPPGLVNIII